MSSHGKPVIAIYPRHYLTPSMTFVYRQMFGVINQFDPIVLAESTDNLDIFPLTSIYLKAGKSLPEKVYSKLVRTITGKYSLLSPLQKNYWRKILIEKRVKLMHAHFGPSGIEILPLAKELGLPLLVTFHGYDASALLRYPTYRSNLQKLFQYAYVLAISKTMLKKLHELGVQPERSRFHYIGVPLEDFRFIPRKPVCEKSEKGELIHFLQVSNFVEKKGHRYTILAFRDFLKLYPHSTLTLAGSGPLHQEIKTLCNRFGISDKVTFSGKVAKPEVISLMEKADVFLHHSVTAEDGDQEGIPTVLMEAMATGLPVISTFHAGIPELIDDGVNGHLIRERDLTGYVDKMITALRNTDNIGRVASDTIKSKFNMKVQNQKLIEIYKKVINEFNRH